MMSNKDSVADLDAKNKGRFDVYFYELDGYYVYLQGSHLQSNGSIRLLGCQRTANRPSNIRR